MWTKLILLKVCSWKGVLGKRAKLKIIQKRNFLDAESVADLRGGGGRLGGRLSNIGLSIQFNI